MDPSAQRPTAIRILEWTIAAGVVLMMSNALIGPLLDPLQTGGESNLILRLMWLPVYGATLMLATLRTPELLRFWFPALLMGVLIAWAAASVLWSIDPGVTQRRVIAVAFTTLFGLYLAASFPGRSLAELLALCALILALGSYVVSLAMPSLGVHQDVNAGSWRGLWYEKNQMGATMVYGALAATAALLTCPPGRRPLWAATLLLCAGLVVMTTSKTSLLVLMLAVGGAFALAVMRRGAALAVALLWLGVTAGGALAFLYFLTPEVLFGLIGKDASLTGRTDIWEAVLRQSRASPWLGFGFAAFWGVDSAPAMWIRHQLEWVVPTAHNGWLDVLVQLGWIGVWLFGAVFALAAIAAVVRCQTLRDGYFAPLFLAVYGVSLLSESFVLNHNSLPWVLAVAAMARVLGPVAVPAPAPLPEPPRLRAPPPPLPAGRRPAPTFPPAAGGRAAA